MIPVGDIEPLFAGLRPLARELPVGGGFLDLIFMNGEGYLTLVETKLWRNPESRRTVVAQIIDYASHLSTWTGVGARLLSRIPINDRGSAGLIDRPRHTIVP